MSDERIAELVAELEGNPASTAASRLVSLLLERGDRVGAELVARRAVEQHPSAVWARHMHARTLVEVGRLQEAYLQWTESLRLDPRDFESRKGLGFLSFRGGDLDGALDHLEIALSVDPSDAGVVQALKRVRSAIEREEGQAAAAGQLGDETLLVDARGRPLLGSLIVDGIDCSAEVAAYSAGVAREATRAARMLDLGEWRSINVVTADGKIHLSQPLDVATLVLVRSGDVRAAQMELLAQAAAQTVRETWKGGAV
ncbi:MAG: hypothetical protein ACE5FJ_07565 [Gemmatimonadales bacterium]